MRLSTLRPRRFTPIDLGPFLGLDTRLPATHIAPGSSPILNNFRSDKGLLVKRGGVTQLGLAVTGTPMAIIRFTTAAGVEHCVLVTTAATYKWNTGTLAWNTITRTLERVYFSYSNITTDFVIGEVVTQAVSGATGTIIVVDKTHSKIYVDWTAGIFNATDVLTGGTSGAIATITSRTAEASLGSADLWTGDESNTIDWTIGTGVDGTWLIITNGKDKPRYWNGLNSTFKNLEDAPGFLYDGFTTCKSVKVFYGHLVLINLTIGGIDYPFDVAWSETNDFVNFGETEDGVGSTGNATITDASGPVRIAKPLGSGMMLYSDDSITAMTHVGLPAVYSFNTIARNTRLLGARTIVDCGSYHLYLSNENIKMFVGDTNIIDVGEKIYPQYKDLVAGGITTKYRANGMVDTAKGRVYFIVPISGDDYVMYTAQFDQNNINEARWSLDYFYGLVSRPTCIGLFALGTAQVVQPVFGFSDSKVATMDDVTLGDFGAVTLNTNYQTPDLTAPVEYTSVTTWWNEIEFEAIVATGGVIGVNYSIDGGLTFTNIAIISGIDTAGQYQKFKYYPNVTAKMIRFQITGYSTTFKLKSFRVWRKPGGVS